jgi:hypothetical protein
MSSTHLALNWIHKDTARHLKTPLCMMMQWILQQDLIQNHAAPPVFGAALNLQNVKIIGSQKFMLVGVKGRAPDYG